MKGIRNLSVKDIVTPESITYVKPLTRADGKEDLYTILLSAFNGFKVKLSHLPAEKEFYIPHLTETTKLCGQTVAEELSFSKDNGIVVSVGFDIDAICAHLDLLERTMRVSTFFSPLFAQNLIAAVGILPEDTEYKNTDVLREKVRQHIEKAWRVKLSTDITTYSFTMPIKQYLNGWQIFHGVKLSEEAIKDFYTQVNSYGMKFYIYKTKQNIENHYHHLQVSQHLDSCMTYDDDCPMYQHQQHLVECDSSLTKNAGYSVRTIRGLKQKCVYTPNVACYSNSPNVSLYLVSSISPDEIFKQGYRYPFIGRFIGLDDEYCTHCRFYGDERVWSRLAMSSDIKNVSMYETPLHLRAYKTREDNVYILPYLDADNEVWHLDTPNVKYDEIGRKYVDATLTPYLCSIGNNVEFPEDMPVSEQVKHFVFDTDTHLAERPANNVHCELTGDVVSLRDLHYNEYLDKYVIKELADFNVSVDTLAKITHNLQPEIVTSLRSEIAELKIMREADKALRYDTYNAISRLLNNNVLLVVESVPISETYCSSAIIHVWVRLLKFLGDLNFHYHPQHPHNSDIFIANRLFWTIGLGSFIRACSSPDDDICTFAMHLEKWGTHIKDISAERATQVSADPEYWDTYNGLVADLRSAIDSQVDNTDKD